MPAAVGAVTVALWLIVAPAAIVPVARGLPTLFVEFPYPLLAPDVVMRTCELDVPAVVVPLLRICQVTESEPPGETLPLPRVTLSGCTSTVARAGALRMVNTATKPSAASANLELKWERLLQSSPAFFRYIKGVGLRTDGRTVSRPAEIGLRSLTVKPFRKHARLPQLV